MNNQRVLGFDFLRGLCAIGVAYYHILGWLGVTHIKLYSVALYGVYIFFVLSGASMYIAYADKIRAGYDLRKFLGLRMLRLLPLLASVVLIGPLIDYGDFSRYDWTFFSKALLNVTFAFGVGNPGQISLPAGGWSLGIEFVFYLMFPAILAFVSGSLQSSLLFLAAVVACQMTYVGLQITGPGDFSKWVSYTQFLSFAGYFVVGCLIGRIVQTVHFAADNAKSQILLWFAFGSLVVALVSLSGSFPEAPLLGRRAMDLPVISAALVLVSGYLRFPSRTALVAAAFGNMSYGLYLLHPLVYTMAKRVPPNMMPNNSLTLAVFIVVMAAVLALVVERRFERLVINWGKGVMARWRITSPKAVKPALA